MVDHVEDSVNAIEVGENPYAELEKNIKNLKDQKILDLHTSLEAKINKYIEDKGLRDRILSNAARVLSDAQAYEKNPDSVPELEYARNSLSNANILMDLTGILVDRAEGKDGGVVGNEAVKGGHFAIKDGGGLFNLLKKLEVFREESRYSSHYKDRQADPGFASLLPGGSSEYDTKNPEKKLDRSITAEGIFEEGLFMFAKVGEEMCTCFQFEGHSHHESRMPLKGVWFYIQKLLKLVGYSLELAGHHCDFVLYKLTGKNVGQYGLSEHTDINPIMVRGTATAPETAQVEEDGRTTENRLFVDTVSRRSQSTEQGQSI